MTTIELRQRLLDLKLELEYVESGRSTISGRTLDSLTSRIYNEINSTYLELTSKLQDECDHNLWYLLRQDKSFNIVSNTCRCIECGMIRTARDERFQGKMIGKNRSNRLFTRDEDNYNKIRNEYDTFVNVFGKEDSAKKLLKKYTY